MSTRLTVATLAAALAAVCWAEAQLAVVDAATFGAKPDGVTVSTAAIQQAIDAAAAAGGGVVAFPRGTYLTGALFLKSRVELRLDEGVTLRAVQDPAAYPEIPSRVAGIEMPWPAAVISAVGQRQVTLSGKGVLDGDGAFWWRLYWGEDQKGGLRADYEKRGLRWAADFDCKRPQAVLFKDCEDVLVKELTIRRSPFWTVHLLYCARATVDGVTIRNNVGGCGPSTDGIDVDSSRDVLIQNCDIECYDDNICLKAGRDADGLRVNRPTENVVIRDCVTRQGHGMLTLGSETSGGIRHVEVSNIRALGTRTGIRFKLVRPRGGVVEDISLHDIVMEDVPTPIVMNVGGMVADYPLPAGLCESDIPQHWKTLRLPVEPPERGIPEYRGIVISNVTATGCAKAIDVRGTPEKPVRAVRLSQIRIQARTAGAIRHAADWTADRVVIEAEDAKPLHLEDCRGVEAPLVTGASLGPGP
jgi:polygalacturonase